MNIRCTHVYSILLCLCVVYLGSSQLVINVKNQGGDVIQEVISANVTSETVTVEFQRPDGTLITYLIDFRNEIQIIKALVLGEEERGQTQYQVMCFVLQFQEDDFIPPDAMAKLRQKNPSAVRTPEDDRGRQIHSMELFVEVDYADIISPHIKQLCSEAHNATYAQDELIKRNSVDKTVNGEDLSSLLVSSVKRFPPGKVSRCSYLNPVNQTHPCSCQLEVCIGWYPCSLKYCKGKDGQGKTASYRCGIRTCRQCHMFHYYVSQKQFCLWDEN